MSLHSENQDPMLNDVSAGGILLFIDVINQTTSKEIIFAC